MYCPRGGLDAGFPVQRGPIFNLFSTKHKAMSAKGASQGSQMLHVYLRTALTEGRIRAEFAALVETAPQIQTPRTETAQTCK
mmetsp:Transcript_34814/g.56954  ORF Transcript_34814/g.56954 Transcript_34814/m.56954 type:complete len:82 (+) Transcript_34814:432-677(+)